MKTFCTSRCFAAVFLAVLPFAPPRALATLRSWSGAASPNLSWTNNNNWIGNAAPMAGDDLEFTDAATHPGSSNNFAAGTTFNSIAFIHNGSSGLGQTYNLLGNSIALNAGVSVVNNGGTGLWDNNLNNPIILNSNQTFSTGPFAGLTLSGPINLNGKILTFDNSSGWPIDVHGVISGAGALIKTNSGTLTIYTNCTYTGSTIIANGTLTLNGSVGITNSTNIALTGAAAVFTAGNGTTLLWSGQTLSGIGSVSAGLTVFPGAVLSPGTNGIGTLTCDNNLTLDTGATLLVNLNGTNAATTYSQLNVQGTVILLNPTLALTLGYTPALGDSFVLINNAGASAVSGTFSGLPEGSFFTNNGASFRITYAGGDGNDVVLTRTNALVPGPSIIVTNTADNGPGSLRAALAAATNGNSIVFATNVTGDIKLTTGELLITETVFILGPGPSILAVDGNASSRVFHITNGVTAYIFGLTITNGAVFGASGLGGGGIWNDHSTLTLSNCTVIFNSSGNNAGGGIYNDGGSGSAKLSIIASTVSQNYTSFGNGGGILNYGDFGTANVSIIASTFDHNAAQGTGLGGGIFNDGNSGSATVTVSNSTFFFNLASQNGGGIYNSAASGTGAVTVVTSTFSGNSANNLAGSFYNNGAGSKLEIGDTILSANPFQGNILNGGTVLSDGYNLCNDTGGGFLTNSTDRINTNPSLGSFANNGGPTFTCAPLWGSPAIDKGKSFGFTTDQRGKPRPYDFSSITNSSGGDGSDIGAFEFIPPAPSLSIDALTNKTMLLQGTGLSNLTYSILANSNLSTTNWLFIGSAPATNGSGSFSFTDSNAPLFPTRFYRAFLVN